MRIFSCFFKRPGIVHIPPVQYKVGTFGLEVFDSTSLLWSPNLPSLSICVPASPTLELLGAASQNECEGVSTKQGDYLPTHNHKQPPLSSPGRLPAASVIN